jgi:hypothetical protein
MIVRRTGGQPPCSASVMGRIDLRRHASVLGIDAIADRNVTIR